MPASSTNSQISSCRQSPRPTSSANLAISRREKWGNPGPISAWNAHGINGIRITPIVRAGFCFTLGTSGWLFSNV